MKWSDPLRNERGSFSGGSIGAILGAIVVTVASGGTLAPLGAAIAIGTGAAVGYAAGSVGQNLVENKPIRPLKIAEKATITGGIAGATTGILSSVSGGSAEAVGFDESGAAISPEGASLAGGGEAAPSHVVIAGEIQGQQTPILVSESAAPGTSLQHVVLDTSLYAPGDVAGPLIDVGPTGKLDTSFFLPESAPRPYPGFLEGPGTYLTSSIPEFGLPATPNDVYGANIPTEKKPGWWSTAAGAAAGQTLLGGIQSFFQAGLRRFEEVIGVIPSPQEATQFARGGGSGGGGGGLKDPPGMPTWLYIVIYVTIAAVIIGALMRGRRR